MNKIERIALNEGATISLILILVVYAFFGYLNIYAIAAEFILFIMSFIFLFISNLNYKINEANIYKFTYISLTLAFALTVLIVLFAFHGILRYSVIILDIIAFFYLFYKYKKDKNVFDYIKGDNGHLKLVYLIAVISIFIIIILLHFLIYKNSQDEYFIDTYSALQFLKGQNPYLPETTKNVFVYFKNINYDFFATPTMYGTFVTSFGYPALAFLIYVPYILIGKFDQIIIILFSLIPFIIIYKKFNDIKIAIYAMFSVLLNVFFIDSAIVATMGILWGTLLMASYYFKNNFKLSGIFYGLSLSAKQFPALVFPFMFYMIYREQGLKKAVLWTLCAAGIFFIINGYFIILSPMSYIKNILSPETLKLFGIGMGISQVSFLNFVYVPTVVFTGIFLSIFLISFILYIKHYDILKYELFAFPLLMLVFNYRVLPGYFIYWPLISVLSINDINYSKNIHINYKKLKHGMYYILTVVLMLILVLSFVNVHHTDPVIFNDVKVNSNNGKIENITVNVAYSGNKNLYFRGIVNESISNGILFNVTHISSSNGIQEYVLTPISNETLSNHLSIELIAYNGTVLGSQFYKVQNNNVSIYHGILYNPPQNKILLGQSQI